MESRSVAPLPCFLVEWFGPAPTPDELRHTAAQLDEGRVRLFMAFTVPDDEMAFAVVEAESEAAAIEVFRQAGAPARRISTACCAVRAREEF
jgi:hypothetical protein